MQNQMSRVKVCVKFCKERKDKKDREERAQKSGRERDGWQHSEQDPSDLSKCPALVRWMLLCTD